ncbi:MAG: cysteine--tRNA ligase [Myxococcales bacterium]|nr:cysteine--tRNA ligase [Myxococcales bacterium]
MALQLYNTRTRRKETFIPQAPGRVGIYVCGPTVYDYCHLGHARCYIVYDTLVRHLRATGWDVTYVRNITDVDDKIIKRAHELNEPALRLTERYTAAFHEDFERLGCLNADIEPKVTEHIPQIITLIQQLISKGFAYETQGDVYFSVPAFRAYGALSGQNLDDLSLGASGRMDDSESSRKRYSADFALWKHDLGAELTWDSPFGRGRPGWHIECSAMSMHYLGATLDLHGGGLDLVFPHHENELAQSEAATNQPFVRMWMHNGFVEVSKEKMSKSLGNFFTIRDVFGYVEPEAIRYFMLGVHYRSPLGLDWETDDNNRLTGFSLLDEAERRLEYLYHTKKRILDVPLDTLTSGPATSLPNIESLKGNLERCLNDDLNTPNALAATAEFLKQVNDIADTLQAKKHSLSTEDRKNIIALFLMLEAQLGLGGDDPDAFLKRVQHRRLKKQNVAASQVQALVDERTRARQEKDFARADRLRLKLEQMHIELLDSAQTTTWRIR